jgi:hypothetical protein
VLIVNKEFLQMYIYVYLNVILKKVCTYLNGDQFFFTFPTSEGSDLLSSHVMQTPTFISKLSDGNVIFRLDVGKNNITLSRAYLESLTPWLIVGTCCLNWH